MILCKRITFNGPLHIPQRYVDGGRPEDYSRPDLFSDNVNTKDIISWFTRAAYSDEKKIRCVYTSHVERMRDLLNNKSFWNEVQNSAYGRRRMWDEWKYPRDGSRWYDTRGVTYRPESIWVGAVVSNQEEADKRIPHLLFTNAKKKFVVVDAAGDDVVELRRFLSDANRHYVYVDSRLSGLIGFPTPTFMLTPPLDWVVAVGQYERQGVPARPCHPRVIDHLEGLCRARSVPFAFLGWGDWIPALGRTPYPAPEYPLDENTEWPEIGRSVVTWEERTVDPIPVRVTKDTPIYTWRDGSISYLVGKRKSGRTIMTNDGPVERQDVPF